MSWLSHFMHSLGAKSPPAVPEEAVSVVLFDRDSGQDIMAFDTIPVEIRTLPDGTTYFQPPLTPAILCARAADGKLHARVSVPPT